MFERFRRDNREDRGGVATAPREETAVREPVDDDRGVTTERGRFERDTTAAPVTRGTVRDVRARQRAEYGGLNWGAAFFGWLVAVGMAAILLGLLSAAGTAFGLTEVSDAE